jgi:hypothetical protein
MNIFCIESFCPQKRTTEICSSVEYTSCMVAILTTDCHEAELCCYLMIHIGNILRPLQLFYFHLLLFTDCPS